MQNPRKIASKLRSRTLARGAFDQALALCDHAANIHDPSKDLETALMTGILVTYARPFTQNNGISALPDAYHKFHDSPSLQQIPRTALSARHQVYAHRDNIESPSLAGSAFPPQKASYLSLELTSSGHSILVYEPAIAFFEIAKFRALIAYQSLRAKADVTQFVAAMRDELGLDNGRYCIADTIVRDA